MSAPFFSIIIPSYNVKDYIGACIDSVVNQPWRDWEIIICDGSTDGTEEICDAYAKAHPNIRVIYGQDQGPSPARNTGIKAVRGEYLMFLDADDLLAEDCLSALHAAICRDPKAALYINDYCEYCEDGQLIPIPLRRGPGGAPDTSRTPDARVAKSASMLPVDSVNTLARLFRENGNYIIFSWRHVFRKSFLAQWDVLYDEALLCCEDYDFFLQCVPFIGRSMATGIMTHYYRKNREGSMTNSTHASPRMYLDNLRAFARWFSYIRQYAPTMERCADSRDFLLRDIASKFLFYTIQSAALKKGSEACIQFSKQHKPILRAAKGRFVSPARIVLSILGFRLGSKLLSRLFRIMKRHIRSTMMPK